MKQIIYCLLAVITILFGGCFLYKVAFRAPAAGASVRVLIPENATVKIVATILDDANVIPSKWEYRLYGFLSPTARHPKAGTYNLWRNTNDRQIARTLAIGRKHQETEVRLIEGWTLEDEIKYLEDEKRVPPERTIELIGAPRDGGAFDQIFREDFSFLRNLPASRSLEGYLFPDTYRVWEDHLPEDAISRQLQEFENRTAGFTVTTSMAPLKTFDEAIILASIVEKEVTEEKDRKLVAGIFLRRMREGIALQTDATLNYILGSGRSRATADDLATDSPFNTYKNRGLPPAPICNPGESAIRAVFHPTPSKFRYFLTDKQGDVLYASTLEGHVQNRVRAGY